jgi:hypothetical protein
MQNANNSQKVILAYSFFTALCSLLSLSGMFLSPSQPGSSIVFGLSLSRLVVALGFSFAFIFFAALFLKAFKDRRWAERFLEQWFGGGGFSIALAWLAGIGLGLGWIGCFLPAYRAGVLGSYWNRLQPVIVFILFVSIATLAVFIVKRINFSIQPLKTFDIFRLGFVIFLASLPFLGISLYSRYNAYLLEDFWYGAGVPILTSQFLRFGGSLSSRRFDLVIVILLYVMTAILWAGEPLQRSFLFTGPTAPNKVLYPFADAATFDMASQFGLIGKGIFIYNTPFFERTLYLSFLIYLHSLFGQNYETLMIVQAVIFAVFPVLVYLIGRSLNMRAVGLLAAILTMMRGANSIAASNMMDLANPKMIMTDFPTAVIVALLTLLVCEWLKDPEKKWHYALWVGGAIGLTIMIRTNGLIFLVFIPLFALLRFKSQWKNWLIASTLMAFAVIVITLPWELRNVSRGAMLYEPILMKIQHVLRTRYPSPSSSLPPQNNILSLVTLRQTKAISSLYTTQDEQACQTITCFAPKHFLHNIVTSILIIPPTPFLDNLRHTVKESYPFWQANWDGKFTATPLFFFLWNIFLIALGISVAWKRQNLPGLTPLAIFVFYNLSNALARTSGGRYIVPVEWVMSFYFVIGILFLISEFAVMTNIQLNPIFGAVVDQHESTVKQDSPFTRTAFILAALFAIGALVPLAEKLYPPRYADFNVTEALQEHEKEITTTGLTVDQVNTFLQTPGSELLVGRTLYPRAYKMGQGEFAFQPFTVMIFPRTAFHLIGPKGADGVILPGGFPKYFPHAADALVIGCRGTDYVDALAVIFLDGSGTAYTRWPASELTCPLRQPVCENNTVCE